MSKYYYPSVEFSVILIFKYIVFRSGPKGMLASAVVGGVLLGMIEGIGILMNRFSSQMYRMPDPMSAPQDPSQLGSNPDNYKPLNLG